MALRKAKQIQRSPPQRLCSISHRRKSRQLLLLLLRQPRSYAGCWVCGARAGQHPGPAGLHVTGGVPSGVSLPLGAALRQPPLAFRRSLHAPPASTPSPPPTPPGRGTSLPLHLLIHNSRLRGQQPDNPLRRDQQAASSGGDARAERNGRSLYAWHVAAGGTASRASPQLGGAAEITQEEEQHHSQGCHAPVQVRGSEMMKIKNAASDDSRLIRKSHV